VAITFAFLFLLYWGAPRRVTTLRHAAFGALLATALWEIAKTGFSYYVRNLAHFVGVYGALEGIIVLALWLELSVAIVLYCGEIVALGIHEGPNSLKSGGLASPPAEGEN
jgi:membrane protein